MFNIEKFKEELSKYGLTLETYDKIITDIDSKIDGENDYDWSEIKDKYVQFMKKYSDYYGPLSMEYMVNDNYWMWVATPMPWEYKGGM